jgi:hypothetical protein
METLSLESGLEVRKEVEGSLNALDSIEARAREAAICNGDGNLLLAYLDTSETQRLVTITVFRQAVKLSSCLSMSRERVTGRTGWDTTRWKEVLQVRCFLACLLNILSPALPSAEEDQGCARGCQ